MRVALISIDGQPRDAARQVPLAIAGKTLARRQLDAALAARCERIVALGHGASAEAVALRHVAEAAGARFDAVQHSHGLLGTVRATDEVLVLAPGLLAETADLAELVGGGARVAVVPAGPGLAAGFERIDASRAWAGAAVVPGARVERLADLPADAEPSSALMRLALQGRAAERELSAEALGDGRWALVADGAETTSLEQAWLARHVGIASLWAPGRWLAAHLVRYFGGRALAAPRALAALAGGAFGALAGGVVSAWSGHAGIGFVLVALGAGLVQVAVALARLRAAPVEAGARGLTLVLALAGDAALLACAILASEDVGLARLFAPLVLLGALLASAEPPRWDAARLPRDRAVLAALLALGAGLGAGGAAVMLAALGLIALNLAETRLTRT